MLLNYERRAFQETGNSSRFRLFTLKPTLIMKEGRLILGGEPVRVPPVQLKLKKKRQCTLTMKEELLRKREIRPVSGSSHKNQL